MNLKKIKATFSHAITPAAIILYAAMALSVYIIFAVTLQPIQPVEAHDTTAGCGGTLPVNCHYWFSIGTGDCGGCGLLSTHFGTRTWAAREICSMEGTCWQSWCPQQGEPCSNEASGAGNEVGCFQIDDVHCNKSWTCPVSGASVTLGTGATCESQLRNPTNNTIVACALSNGGQNWSIWGAASICRIPSPPGVQYFNPGPRPGSCS